eukprot:g33070.t1
MLDSASDRELKEAKARATKEQPLKQPLEGDGPTGRIYRAASMARMAYMPASMVMMDSAETVKDAHDGRDARATSVQ